MLQWYSQSSLRGLRGGRFIYKRSRLLYHIDIQSTVDHRLKLPTAVEARSFPPAASCAESEILEICLIWWVEKVVTTQHLYFSQNFPSLCSAYHPDMVTGYMWVVDHKRSEQYSTLVVTAKHQLTNYLYRDPAVLPAIHPDLCSAYANNHQFCPHRHDYGKPCINVVQLIIPSLPASVCALFLLPSLFASLPVH
jgi:hypothetical protein